MTTIKAIKAAFGIKRAVNSGWGKSKANDNDDWSGNDGWKELFHGIDADEINQNRKKDVHQTGGDNSAFDICQILQIQRPVGGGC